MLRCRLAAHQPAASDREAEIERLRAEVAALKADSYDELVKECMDRNNEMRQRGQL